MISAECCTSWDKRVGGGYEVQWLLTGLIFWPLGSLVCWEGG